MTKSFIILTKVWQNTTLQNAPVVAYNAAYHCALHTLK